MKIRQGFVSNSSSSSFCIAKCYMAPEQVKKFSNWLAEVRCSNEPLYETYIHQTSLYFVGEKSVHENRITEFLKSIGVDVQYVEEVC